MNQNNFTAHRKKFPGTGRKVAVGGVQGSRQILHVDLDAFFASVEQMRDPSLKGKPVIVGGDPNGRGVVAAASYEARKFGVHSAMPVARAKRLCPDAIFVRGSHGLYSEISKQFFEILETYSPLVESMSLDEGYIDLTGCERLHGGPAEKTAARIRHQVEDELGICASIGMGTNKLIAKIASGMAKPNGFLRVPPGQERNFLKRLPIKRIPGIGPKGEEQLRRLGIKTVGQLTMLPLDELERSFGEWGTRLYYRSRGQCDSPVRAREEAAKSISRETTLEEDSLDRPYLNAMLSYLTEKTAAQLREEGLYARTVTLKLRFYDFKTITRSRTLSEASCEDHILFESISKLFTLAAMDRIPVRLVGVSLSGLTTDRQKQLDLFHPTAPERWGRLYKGIDRLRTKYGFETILRANSVLRGRRTGNNAG
ncbi:MAG: DNA polymerase IV [Candidatus Nitronauta litoralis]|uniref:DNA polymerase IV n=1 Tax=Candidatus Nitronauta litoralis TaxID=2705533 RepID=A0A7T0BUZ3_9BACT|nr:MAG: DNA polymerase IV [Candidatus Nitronauta litoralis]